MAAAAATLVGSSSVRLFVCWLVGWFVGCLSGWLTGCVSARSPHQRKKQQKQQQHQPQQQPQQQQRAQLLPWRYGCDYVVAAALTPSSLDIVRWHYYIALPLWVASLQRAKNPESWQSKTTKATPQKGGHGQTAGRCVRQNDHQYSGQNNFQPSNLFSCCLSTLQGLFPSF